MYTRQHGLTLIELIITVLIIAVLAAVAVPSLHGMFHLARATSYSNSLLSSLWLARSEAVKRNTRVAMCKSTDNSTCTTTGLWSDGWIVFLDSNNNALRESSEQLLLVEQAWSADWKGKGNSPVENYVSYTALGLSQLISGGFQAGTITVCSAGSRSGRKVIINSQGRSRVETAEMTSC